MKKKILIFALLFLTPVFASAATTIEDIIDLFGRVVASLIPIATGLALLFFIWALAKFILNADNDEERKKGKQQMMWGIVALFVLVSIWGIVGFIGRTLGVGPDRAAPFPQFGGGSGGSGGSYDPACMHECLDAGNAISQCESLCRE